MLIIGNSHVSLFNNGINCPQEHINIHWVGALKIDWFFNKHPGAIKIEKDFKNENSWKVLFIDTHDMHQAVKDCLTLDTEAVLQKYLEKYKQIFKKLDANKNFIWARSELQSQKIKKRGVTSVNILELTDQFQKQLTDWCLSNQIPVLHPKEASLLPKHFEEDGLHIKPQYSSTYLNPLAEITQLELTPGQIFYSLNFNSEIESEAFSSLVLNQLALQSSEAVANLNSLKPKLQNKIQVLAKNHGIDIDLTDDTNFVEGGILDSLDLVELYSFASEEINAKINFNVNLRDHNTLKTFYDFILKNLKNTLFYEDFVISQSYDWYENRDEIIVAEKKIINSSSNFKNEFNEIIFASTKGNHQYGIIFFWQALLELDQPDKAIVKLRKSCSPELAFPVNAEHCKFYIDHLSSAPLMFSFSDSVSYKTSSGEEVSEPTIRSEQLLDISQKITHNTKLIEEFKFNDALSNIEELIEQFPNHPEILLQKAHCLYSFRDSEGALKQIEKLFQIWPYFAECFYVQACIFIQMRQNTKALEAIKKANQLDPKDGKILALLEELKNQSENSISTKEVKMNLQLAHELYNKSNYSEAEQTLLQVVRIDQTNISAFLLLAKTFHALGKTQAATDLINEILTHEPSHTEALSIKTLLQSSSIPSESKDSIWWTSEMNVTSEDDLFLEFARRSPQTCQEIQYLYVIGAHLYQERELFTKVFPNLKKVILFEPIPEVFQQLQNIIKNDPLTVAFPYAISDTDGFADFHITNNFASSSLLNMKEHREIFPSVTDKETINVQVRKLESVILEHNLPRPDILFVDVQGAEYIVLSSIPQSILDTTKVIYTESSTSELYEGAKNLEDLIQLLNKTHEFKGFAALTNRVRNHGNALFIKKHHESNLSQANKNNLEASFPTPPSLNRPAVVPKWKPDGHFYSPNVDINFIESQIPSLWAKKTSSPGVDYNHASHLDFFNYWAPSYIQNWNYPAEKPHNWAPPQYHDSNNMFIGIDAYALFIFLQHFKPKQLIEVGSGFTSFLTADVNARLLNNSIDFTVIEPYRDDIDFEKISGINTVVRSIVQDIPISFFEKLNEGDILFIDSSHVSKVGSDVNYLVFEILPKLKKGVIIHFHDIFLPNEYLKHWILEKGMHWNEQYIIQALLQYSHGYEVIFGSGYALANLEDEIIKLYGSSSIGGSLWLTKKV